MEFILPYSYLLSIYTYKICIFYAELLKCRYGDRTDFHKIALLPFPEDFLMRLNLTD